MPLSAEEKLSTSEKKPGGRFSSPSLIDLLSSEGENVATGSGTLDACALKILYIAFKVRHHTIKRHG